MVLFLIGIGLSTEKDITLRGLEAIKSCDKVYLESYTSILQCSVTDIEKIYAKKIILANRDLSEQGAVQIVEEAKTKNVAFLVIGDPFSATTHIELFKLAIERMIPIEIINNASILTAIGITGLQLYKFGKTTSIPFLEDHPLLETPYNVIKENQSLGLHTLCLLDLKPEQQQFMTVKQALIILQSIESRKHEKLISDDLLVIGCARLGSRNFLVKAGKLCDIITADFGPAPHCVIIPGKLHFNEEEMIKIFR
ncbi:diphthine synthase [Candidatus Woesearchaeota archaeon]|nr:diphthine synthase [Candidatus Woesearchaeota archaeon]